MNHTEVIRGLQALIEEIDRELDKLRVLIRQGGTMREQLLGQIAAIKVDEASRRAIGNDP
jgi:hypothetical protein